MSSECLRNGLLSRSETIEQQFAIERGDIVLENGVSHRYSSYPELGTVAYYVPTIPDVWGTDRYQHALAIVEASDDPLLLAHSRPPAALADRARVHVVESGRDNEGTHARAREAVTAVADHLDDESNSLFCTSYPYEATLAGWLAHRRSIRWVADIYETPAQYRLNDPLSYHQITARGLAFLLERAPHSVHSFDPKTPYQYGKNRKFLTNGAPVEKIDAVFHDRDKLWIAWVGSPRLDRGGRLLVDALTMLPSRILNRIQIDVYGKKDPAVQDAATDAEVREVFRWRDRVPHDEALSACQAADVGYCVLPNRTDWRFAPPIKVGEYLAAGALALVPDFPGMRMMAGEAGRFVAPTPEAIATELQWIVDLPESDRRMLSRQARARAEAIDWSLVRRAFCHALIE